jgi:hypothetical protein
MAREIDDLVERLGRVAEAHLGLHRGDGRLHVVVRECRNLGRGRGPSRGVELLDQRVVACALEQRVHQRPEGGVVLLLLGHPRRFLEHLDGLLRLADEIERSRQRSQRGQILGVGLEAQLQLGQRRQPVVLAVALEVELRGHARVLRLLPVLEQALEHLERIVVPAELDHDVGRLAEALHRLAHVTEPRVGVGHPQVRDRVLRIEVEHLLEDVERIALASLLPQPRRHLVVGGQRIAGQAELGVDLGEPRSDVAVAALEVRGVPLDDAADLLVDRDGLYRESFAVVVLADLLVGGDGLLVLLELEVEVADLQQRPHVARILGDELLVLHDRLVVPLLVDKLLSDLEDLVAIDRHRGRGSSGN